MGILYGLSNIAYHNFIMSLLTPLCKATYLRISKRKPSRILYTRCIAYIFQCYIMQRDVSVRSSIGRCTIPVYGWVGGQISRKKLRKLEWPLGKRLMLIQWQLSRRRELLCTWHIGGILTGCLGSWGYARYQPFCPASVSVLPPSRSALSPPETLLQMPLDRSTNKRTACYRIISGPQQRYGHHAGY